MSRLKKVAPEVAIEAAMLLFWKHGYHNASTRLIEEQTGITRFSLQTSYGGKMALFLTALDSYLDSFEVLLCPSMVDGNPETLAIWFEGRAKPAQFAEATCFGCLLLNSTVEFKAENKAINQRADRFFGMVRGGFYNALTAMCKSGEMPDGFDCKAYAEILLGAAVGLNIVIRAAADNAAGTDMAHATAAMIRGWSTG